MDHSALGPRGSFHRAVRLGSSGLREASPHFSPYNNNKKRFIRNGADTHRNVLKLRKPCSLWTLIMRRIRANAIAILTVAWILGTFYYLWQDNKPRASPSSASQARAVGAKSRGPKPAASGRVDIRREDRTLPLIVRDEWTVAGLYFTALL